MEKSIFCANTLLDNTEMFFKSKTNFRLNAAIALTTTANVDSLKNTKILAKVSDYQLIY